MRVLDKKMILISLIAGAVAGLIDLVIYGALVDTMSRPLLIAVLMVVYGLIVGIALSVSTVIFGSSADELWFLSGRLLLTVGMVVCLVLVLLMGMLLEWIYDVEEIAAGTDNVFIFILDESGSMAQNDPNLERYRAVNEVMRNMSADYPYMVYMFDSQCVKIRDLAPRSSGEVIRPVNADETMGGQTYIGRALETVYNDIKNGSVGKNVRPHVILLTDGYASDMGIFRGRAVLNSYSKAGIPVSSVGLGVVDEALMRQIAEKTGGTFIQVSGASQLAQGFSSAATIHGERDLLSARNLAQKDILYLFLRILFLTLLGGLIGLVKCIACGDEDNAALILLFTAGGALVGALILEIGLKLGLPRALCQVFYWLLLSITPCYTVQHVAVVSRGQKQIYAGSGSGGSGRSPFGGASSGGSGRSSSGRSSGNNRVNWSR